MNEIHHHYVFTIRNDPIPFYERTFGDKNAAYRWLLERPYDGFVLTDMVPKDFWY